MVMKLFWEEKFHAPNGKAPKHTLKVPCFFFFFPFKFGEWERFFSFFPGSQCVCSHYVLNGFSSHSQYIPQVLNEFPNMFSTTPHFYPIFFGKNVCAPFTYIAGPKGRNSILQSQAFCFGEPS
jgi:hypothetical protein